jgi:NADH:ubiquinone oxidoreductase subunit E
MTGAYDKEVSNEDVLSAEEVSQPGNGNGPLDAKVSCQDVDLEKVREIIKSHEGERGSLISILQACQAAYGYLPRTTLEEVSKALKVPFSKIFGVVTFYSQFHLEPRGKHIIRVCLGTACHVRGGERILEKVSEVLAVEPGGTTRDLMFTLERVACLGACGLSPAMMIDDQTYGRLTPKKVEKILKEYSKGA